MVLLVLVGKGNRQELFAVVELSALLVSLQQAAADFLVLDLINGPDCARSTLANNEELLRGRDIDASDALCLVHS